MAVTAAVRAPVDLRAGLALALVSAAAFGLSGSLARSLLEIGWSPAAVVTARIGGAFAVLALPAALQLWASGLPSAAQARRLVGYGVIAVAGAQLCFFSAVQYLSVGVALLLEYLAPVLLIGWHWWRTGRRPTRGVLGGAALAIIGMILVLDVLTGVRLHPAGVAWGLGAAVCLSGYFLLSEEATPASGSSPLLMTAAGTGVGAVVVLGAAATGLLPLDFTAGRAMLAGTAVAWWLPALLLVGVSAVLAYLTGIVAIRRLGSSLASFVALSEVVFAVVFAVVLLAQQPGVGQVLGGALVLAGIAVVQRQDRFTRQ